MLLSLFTTILQGNVGFEMRSLLFVTLLFTIILRCNVGFKMWSVCIRDFVSTNSLNQTMKDGNHGSQVDSSRLCFPPTRRFKSKTVRKSNKKHGIKNFTFSYIIQKKCGYIANKIPNATDDDQWTFTYRWP